MSSPISSFDTPKRPCFGLLKPRPMRRSAFCSSWRTHGPKRWQARKLAAALRRSAGHREAVAQVAASLPGHPIGHSSRSLRMISKILAAVANHTLRRAENGTRGLATSDRTDLTNETTARRIIELGKAGSTIRAGCAVARCGVSGAARIRRRPPFPSLPGSARRVTFRVQRAVRMEDPP